VSARTVQADSRQILKLTWSTHSPTSPRRSALFRGISPSLIRSVPAAASTFLAFEVTKSGYEMVSSLAVCLSSPRSLLQISSTSISCFEG
jgi:hypothetical protein